MFQRNFETLQPSFTSDQPLGNVHDVSGSDALNSLRARSRQTEEKNAKWLVSGNEPLSVQTPSNDLTWYPSGAIMSLETEAASDTDERDYCNWNYANEQVLFCIFQYLNARDLLKAGETCTTWHNASMDSLLWKALFYRDFRVDRSVSMKPGKVSWLDEYKRLTYHTPLVETEHLKAHSNEVLHVSFAHNGSMFTTCSADGSFVVWEASYPAKMKYERYDMQLFCWEFTEFSQFNESDTLLLVSGIYFGSQSNIAGEIAVFHLGEELELRCRVLNKPYCIFGAWYGDKHLLSGGIGVLSPFVMESVIWLNKASQEAESEHIPITNPLLRFCNNSGNFIRSVMVSKCLSPSCEQSSENAIPEAAVEENHCLSTKSSDTSTASSHASCSYNLRPGRWSEDDSSERSDQSPCGAKSFSDQKLPKSTENLEKSAKNGSIQSKLGTCADSNRVESPQSSDECDILEEDENSENDLCVLEDKYLIFSLCSEIDTPHQIGIKRIKPVVFPRRLSPGLSVSERIAKRNRRLSQEPLSAEPDVPKFDEVDHVIDLGGHITGMALSPDHRYLYVNSRPWPLDMVDFHNAPPVAQEVDMHVIDLVTMKFMDTVFRGHKAYTPSRDCSYIFLDVCDDYVASGAEDRHGYLWDRHYGTCITKFPHQSTVKSVAFNPKDSEMLITVSSDYTIKIWRSLNRVKDLGCAVDKMSRGVSLLKPSRCRLRCHKEALRRKNCFV